ncbi:hypothetical protein BT67DRAFT_442832 [Trichocladium antarcticum]|uniref:Uncharacterized protein n=1 Tax=Trichocladium antarcticum TaxID=1450529 RepID=A0AAN6ZD09_9PEZI|nr:hypothetical protein BT67DRAFT_442832 [Trichocladium antarcticum]
MAQLVSVALYHRDRFSKGHLRDVFGYEAYHWSIVLMPEVSQGRDCYVFEATDASAIDPVTIRLTNPTMDWWLRGKNNVDPTQSSKLLGCIVIGQTPSTLPYSELLDFFRRVPLPVRDRDPQQSCVTWAADAIRALQRQGWVREFELGRFQDWALSYADERMRGLDSREPKVTHYSV